MIYRYCNHNYTLWDGLGMLEERLLEGKPGGWRTKGRPRQTWMDDAESDPRNMGVKRWGTQALDITEWAPVVEEAKAKLKEP